MNNLTFLWGESAGLQINDEVPSQAASPSEIQLQATLHVEFKQTVVQPLLALDQSVAHRAIAFAAF